jgi:hypothetical protein
MKERGQLANINSYTDFSGKRWVKFAERVQMRIFIGHSGGKAGGTVIACHSLLIDARDATPETDC